MLISRAFISRFPRVDFVLDHLITGQPEVGREGFHRSLRRTQASGDSHSVQRCTGNRQPWSARNLRTELGDEIAVSYAVLRQGATPAVHHTVDELRRLPSRNARSLGKGASDEISSSLNCRPLDLRVVQR